jgi:hypothetical protein
MVEKQEPAQAQPKKRLRLYLQQSDLQEDPSENDGAWKLYSFCQRHRHFKHPDELRVLASREHLEPMRGNKELKRKLKNGLAHVLSYYEHGNSLWMLKDEPVPGVEFRWDGVRVGGLLVWEHPDEDMGPTTKEDRAADARQFLKCYNAWANGEQLEYVLEDEDGEVVDSCCAISDMDWYWGELLEHTRGAIVEIHGDHADLADAQALQCVLVRDFAEAEELIHG